jgi:hypothetical protein
MFRIGVGARLTRLAVTDLLRIGVPNPGFGAAGLELVFALARGEAPIADAVLETSEPDARLVLVEPAVGVVLRRDLGWMLVALDRWDAHPRAEEVAVARRGQRPRPRRDVPPPIVWTPEALSAIGPHLEDMAVLESLGRLRARLKHAGSGWYVREIVAHGLALAVVYIPVGGHMVVLAGGQLERRRELSQAVREDLAGAQGWLTELQRLLLGH